MNGLLLTVCLIAALCPVPARADIDTGKMAHYPFDADVFDVSGHNNNGVIVG